MRSCASPRQSGKSDRRNRINPFDERAEQWKASGYVPPVSAATMPRDGGDDVLKLVEEELKGFLARRARSGQDKDIEIRETSEEPVVPRTAARVVEEISVGKQSSERTETVRDTLRSTKADVESLGDDESVDESLLRFSGSERRMNSGRAYAGVERRASA